jgi:hypothetical protein
LSKPRLPKEKTRLPNIEIDDAQVEFQREIFYWAAAQVEGATIVKPPKESTVLTEQMSEASRGLLGALMGQGDDMGALQRARYVAPVGANIVKPLKESTLLTDQMSEASRSLLASLMGRDDDMAALQSARFVPLPGVKIVASVSTPSKEEEVDDAEEGEDNESEAEQEGDYEADQEDEYETKEGETDDETLSQAILNALSQSQEDIMAKQHARFVQYLAAASELPESDDDGDEEYEVEEESKEEGESDESIFESPPQDILGAFMAQNKEDVIARQQSRHAQYLAASSEQPEGLDEPSQPPPEVQRAAIEVATVLAKEKLALSLAEKMTSFLETVPNESALERKEETPILATCSGASATTSIRCWLAAEYYKEVLQIQTGGANKGINIFL